MAPAACCASRGSAYLKKQTTMSSQDQQSFRDSIGTIRADGKRNWIYPKKPKGRYYTYRTILSIILLAIFFVLPFIKVNGEQYFLIDILNRKFHIFGRPFYPQDFYLLAIGGVTTVLFIVLFTVVYGRIWCGWLCPQTIFMEMVFRKIEYAIEGDRPKQMKLDRMPWNAEKIRKKVTKWLIFFLVSVLITSTMWAYVAGSDYVIAFWKNPLARPNVLLIYLAFTLVFYFTYAWFREQVCIIVCPYGRLQGVLTDENTILVTYDYKRGEKRGPLRKGQDRAALGLGDCIDCKQCVHVCPTGIDIRNGTQMECINCTACMDACDAVMDKIGKPRGLIRYASKVSIETGTKKLFTPRVKFYTAILAILFGVLVYLIVSRPAVQIKVQRQRGLVFTELPNGKIENIYEATFINKSGKPLQNLHVKLIEPQGIHAALRLAGEEDALNLKREDVKQMMLFIDIPREEVRGKTPIKIGVFDETGKKLDDYDTYFIAPVQ